jgi:AcrR family transcriptional regulator
MAIAEGDQILRIFILAFRRSREYIFAHALSRAGPSLVGRKRKAEPVRTKQDRHGIRDRLARAAAELFARRGLHGTQVADIAKTAGVSIGAFYRYFRDKDELYCELVQERFDDYEIALRGLLDGLQSATLTERIESIRKVFRRVLTMHLEDPETFMLWHRHAHDAGPMIRTIVDRFSSEVEDQLVEILDRTIVVGNMLDEPTRRLVAVNAIGILNTVANRMIETGDSDVDGVTDVCTRMLAGGLLALAPPDWQSSLLALYQKEMAERARSRSQPQASTSQPRGGSSISRRR